MVEVLAQPFELRFATAVGWRRHVPDFLVAGSDAVWLINVRPAGRVKDEDRLRFAAAGEVAVMAGWRALVVSGWREGVLAVLDALSAQRRVLQDPLGLQRQLKLRLMVRNLRAPRPRFRPGLINRSNRRVRG
ncbi:MAG TPA: hypothetical protein DGG94_05890 [Micromonosporaceae bacterium]|nr:hypothetical protein [Micromonosporaceae bacterium]HCU49327.1 hypothetical protein [Micromonosporaceae bacterium]